MTDHPLVTKLIEAGDELPEALRAELIAAGSAVVPELIRRLDSDEMDSVHSAEVLGALGAKEAIPAFVRLVATVDPLDYLWEPILAGFASFGAAALEPLLAAHDSAATEEEREGLRTAMAGLKVRDERILSRLVAALRVDPTNAAMALAEYGDPAAVPRMLETFDRPECTAGDLIELEGAIRELGGALSPQQQRRLDRAKAPRAEPKAKASSRMKSAPRSRNEPAGHTRLLPAHQARYGEVYRLRVTALYEDKRALVAELHGRHTLLDLHDLIVRALGLDDDHLSAFYLSGEAFDSSTAFEERMGAAALGRLDLHPGMRFLHLHDFGDENRHEIEVVAVRTGAAAEGAPVMIEPPPTTAEGDLEREDEGDAEEAGDGEIEERFVPALNALRELRPLLHERAQTAEGRVAGVAPATLATIARQLLETARNPMELFAIGEEVELDAGELLLDAIMVLALQENPETGISLARQACLWMRSTEPLVAAANELSLKRRTSEARTALLAADALGLGQSVGDLLGTADAWLLADAREGEARLRAALELRWLGERQRQMATRRLALFLSDAGREAEAAEVLGQARAAEDAAERAAAGTVVRDAPKVGRNDPCPCGSGKKAKKCHGAG